MAIYLTDQAICFRVLDFSETSQIVTLFTQNHGLVGLIAKGSKRQNKKTVAGPLDLLAAGEVVFIPPKNASELGTLSEWELRDHRTALRTNLPALNAGYLVAEATMAMLHPGDSHDVLFTECANTLSRLTDPDRRRLIVAYLKTLLTQTGYQPQLDQCVEGHKQLEDQPTWRFSPRAGGIVCPQCSIQGKTIEVTTPILRALSRLAPPTQLIAAARAADPTALQQAFKLLIAMIESITDRALKTQDLPMDDLAA
jgi:DNA repair protein RecO (recombination protein O)